MVTCVGLLGNMSAKLINNFLYYKNAEILKNVK